jgi:hypothetical protein
MRSTFDSAWVQTGTQVIAPSTAVSMTVAPYGDDAMIAWSTENDCHMTRVVASIGASRPGACRNPRIATDYATRQGAMVFQAGSSVWLTDIFVASHNELSSARELRESATSPRILFDGERYWVGYIDPIKHDLVIGYIDENGGLVSTPMYGVTPKADAYDMIVMNGSLWVFSADETGYGAQRICLAHE